MKTLKIEAAPGAALTLRRRVWLGTAAVAALGATSLFRFASASSEARVVPAFKPDGSAAPASTAATEVAVLAGGCFWGVQGVYQHVKGVANAVSGYAGGEQKTATYGAIGSGRTGHAEAVQVHYDPRQIGYAALLQIYFSVVHDPTQLDRQGPDFGTQYRSTIFPQDEAQARLAKAYIAQLNQARAFKDTIVTTIEPARTFYPAEAYHQDYMVRNPLQPYIVMHDAPKVADLKTLFPQVYRADPVLVRGQRPAA